MILLGLLNFYRIAGGFVANALAVAPDALLAEPASGPANSRRLSKPHYISMAC
jgi:hypothetical protein